MRNCYIQNEMKKEYKINTPDDFIGIIKDVLSVENLKGNHSVILALYGDLGAGKTTFTQKLGKYLGVKESITSPTFTIVKQYCIDYHEQFERLVHIDAYRFESEAEAGPVFIKETLDQPNIVACVEWPERLVSILPKNTIDLYFTILENDVRKVTVSYKE